MKRFLLFLLCSFFSYSHITGQAPWWNWARHSGGINYDRATAIMRNNDNSLLVAGYFRGTAYFQADTIVPGLYNAMFLAVYNRNGDMLWVKDVAECSGVIEPKYLFQDTSNNYTVVGTFGTYGGGGTVHFSPSDSFVSAGNSDIFIAKFDPIGNLLWAQAIRSTEDASASFAASMDKSGNVYIAGNMFDNCTFTGTALTLATDALWHIYIAKYTSAGGSVTANKMISSTVVMYPAALVAGFDDNIYLAGKYLGNPIFGMAPDTFSIPGALPYNDIFLAKFSLAGTHPLWAFNAGGASDDFPFSLDADDAGNLWMSGGYATGIRFFAKSGTDTLTAPTSAGELFVAEYDTGGAFHWAKSAGYSPSGAINVYSTYLCKASHQLYLTGNYTGYPYFGDATHLDTISVMDDLFVAQYGDSGTLDWVQRGGSAYGENSYGIAADDSGAAYIAGYFDLSVVLQTSSAHGDTLFSYGYDDILVAKLGGSTDTGATGLTGAVKQQPVIKLYPNPSKGQFTVEVSNLSVDEIQISNVLGQEIIRHKILNRQSEMVDVTQFVPGLYFLSIRADDKQYTFKFVKE